MVRCCGRSRTDLSRYHIQVHHPPVLLILIDSDSLVDLTIVRSWWEQNIFILFQPRPWSRNRRRSRLRDRHIVCRPGHRDLVHSSCPQSSRITMRIHNGILAIKRRLGHHVTASVDVQRLPWQPLSARSKVDREDVIDLFPLVHLPVIRSRGQADRCTSRNISVSCVIVTVSSAPGASAPTFILVFGPADINQERRCPGVSHSLVLHCHRDHACPFAIKWQWHLSLG